MNNETLLTQLDGEVQRCTTMVVTQRETVAVLQSKLSEELRTTESLARAAEACEDKLIDGNAPAALLQDLHFRHAESESAARRVAAELRLSERLLTRAESALANVHERADIERRRNRDRQIAEIAAPILDTVVAGLKRLLALDGSQAVLTAWIQAQSARTDLSSGYRSVFCEALGELLAGKDTFLSDFIVDLQTSAPDLVSAEMQAYLDALRQRKEVAIGREMARIRQVEVANAKFGPNRLAAIEAFNELMRIGKPTAA